MTEFDYAQGSGKQSVIVLGVDTPIGVAILRDLAKHGYKTVGVGRNKHSIGFASRHCHVPIVRAGGDISLVEQLKGMSEQFNKAYLLVISESDLLLVNRFRADLEKCLILIAPTQCMLEQVLDKDTSICLAKQVGIRTPHTFIASNIEMVRQQAVSLTYPRVLKWSDPNKVGQLLSDAGLELKKCDYALTPDELVSKLEAYEKIAQYPMAQEYCSGKGIGQMFLIRDGNIILEFQHERIHEWPPEGGVSTYCKSISLELHKECRKRSVELLKLLNWEGVAMVEYRYSRETGEYYFMEINGRFWGSLPLAIAAGVPFGSELVRSYSSDYKYKRQSQYLGIGCRYMIPETRRLLRLILKPNKVADPTFRYSKVKEIASYFINFANPATRYYLFCFSDMGPFFKDVINGFRKVFNRIG